MTSNVFHDHLDICERCRNHPFNLCSIGERLLLSAALEDSNPLINPMDNTTEELNNRIHELEHQVRILRDAVEAAISVGVKHNDLDALTQHQLQDALRETESQ